MGCCRFQKEYHISSISFSYMVRDSNLVYQQCSDGQAIAFLTTTESYISYSSTTDNKELTSTEETITTATISTSTTRKVPDSTLPTKVTDTSVPTKVPDTSVPTKVPDTSVPTKLPDTSVPTKELNTTPLATETATTDGHTSISASTNEPLSTTTPIVVNSESTTSSQTTDEISSTSLSRPTTQNTQIIGSVVETTSRDTPAATTIHELTPDYLSTTGMYVTSSNTKGNSPTVDLTTISTFNSTALSNTNTTDTSCNLTCLNGGICITDPFESCLCTVGWTGESCDLCAGSTCDQGYCVMVGATPKCVCYPGYTGVSCNESHVCNSSEISIGGNCYTFNYVYETCQENYCVNQPGTECLVNSEGIYCLCKDEFNPTDSTPCGCPAGEVRHLNGTCVEIDCRGVSSCSHGSCYFRSFYNFGCLCDEGWEGENCDLVVTQCGDHHCNNNGTCIQDPDAMCHCADAWTGTECDMCGKQECHHGVCILDRYNQPMCVCDKEYSGPKCDQVMQCSGQEFGGHCYGNDLDNFTPCVENVCLTGQLCVAALHTFKNDLYCVCKENITEAYLSSDCGCPERSLRNYRGECIDILL
ncbi:delta and Notch-like epidermal growth factor-related receptor isoform X2 [Pecten maximus]|uniref:delta and Notch-like epidermal growth factor-related receptor isoform X2 n=1 Tax=Pecten maximus TaxID=6579 RepID=UPI001458BFB8|nr:delta and Notch-like epidermal growth factor-related receptor isoform X2 [Pecten maximus]